MVASYGISGALPATLALAAVFCWARDRLRAVRARAAEESNAPLKDGQTVIRGTVELARGASHAVRVEVEQLGFESCSKGKWSHRWVESDRRTLTHPFYVRVASGQRIRVEPSADVNIIDDLDEVVRVREDVRIRAASITPDEEVFVFGMLGTGPDPEQADTYRNAGQGPVLRSPASSGMLIATASPAGRFRASAFVHGLWAVGFAILLAVLQLVHVMHTVRVTAGQPATGAVVSKRTFTTKGSKGKVYHHFELKTRGPDGASFDEEIEESAWQPLKAGDPIAMVHVPGRRGYEILGDRPTVHVAVAIVPLVLITLLAVAYWFSRQAIRPWYERNVEDTGGGKLRDAIDDKPGPEPAIPLRPM